MNLFLQSLIDALSFAGVYALIALGIALIFGVMNLVNFAHGELVMVAGYVFFLLQGAPWPLVIVATVCAAVITALLMERVAFRPVRSADPTTLLVTSFAVSFLLQSIAMLTMGARPKSIEVPAFVGESIAIGGLRVPKLELVTIALAFVLLMALNVFLRRTALGRQMRAAAEDFQMARVLGVRADTIVAMAFALSGILAGCLAVIYVAQTASVSPVIGLQLVLIGFVSTVIGGLGSLEGAAIGGFVLGFLTVMIQTILPPELRGYRDAVVFAIVITILLIRPHGLLGSLRRSDYL